LPQLNSRRPRSTVPLPPLPSLEQLGERLSAIFPEGIPQRNYFVRPVAVKTVFVMLYVGAVEGSDCWFRPNQVSRMTDAQATRTTEQERLRWTEASLRPRTKGQVQPGGWAADTSREPVRDETLRNALFQVGAAVQRSGIDTTSSKPRWALALDFVELLLCPTEELGERISSWRERHLSRAALARILLAQRGITAASTADTTLVTFPNGESRRMAAGQSTNIAKAVIEQFTHCFLVDPGVLWVSESGNKVTLRDDDLARRVGLEINTQLLLPDIILVDLGQRHPVFVFIEIVASDGPVDEQRKAVLLEMLHQAGHGDHQAAFLTAFWDRGGAAYRRAASVIAGNSFVWAATEPEKIIIVRDTTEHGVVLHDLL
jgi:hypothetical protein